MSKFGLIKQQLQTKPKIWLITGVAGFIGSNLLEVLLKLDQEVIGLDNFVTGLRVNLNEVESLVTQAQWSRFRFVEGDICNLEVCEQVCAGVDYVLHQAALGSVPRSIKNPIPTNYNNVNGFLNMLVAARNAEVKNFVYAASSSTYGDHPGLPKVEDEIGKPLSPYAVTKLVNELYAGVFARSYGFKSIGLRYFNVFGRRQDPDGAYAAVIPKWISALVRNEAVYINGDGETSRDFCYIDNAVQANILAATAIDEAAINQIYNVAVGEQTNLNQLYFYLKDAVSKCCPDLKIVNPIYHDFRIGDVRHSLADIQKIKSLLGYEPTHIVSEGLNEIVDWYVNRELSVGA